MNIKENKTIIKLLFLILISTLLFGCSTTKSDITIENFGDSQLYEWIKSEVRSELDYSNGYDIKYYPDEQIIIIIITAPENTENYLMYYPDSMIDVWNQTTESLRNIANYFHNKIYDEYNLNIDVGIALRSDLDYDGVLYTCLNDETYFDAMYE